MLIFVHQQKAVAHVIELSAIACKVFEWQEARAGAIPLLDESFSLLGEGLIERLQEGGCGVVKALSKCEAERELIALAEVQLAGQRDVSIFGQVKLPIHL